MGVTNLTTSQVVLSPAAAGQVDEIAAVWHQGWRDAHLGNVPDALPAQRQIHHLRGRVAERLDATTVALQGGRVAGFVTIDADELEQIYVARDFRGSGIAAVLLAHAESLLAGSHPRAWLAVVEGNERARRFYERHGWSDAGPMENLAWAPDGGRIAVPCRRYEKALGEPAATSGGDAGAS